MSTTTRRTITIKRGAHRLVLWLPKAATEADHMHLVRIARRHGASCEATFGPPSDLPENTIDELADALRTQ